MHEIRLLGSGGHVPTAARETCCTLLREGDRALVIDAGTGLRHLLTSPALLDGVEAYDIVLTHFHLDHIVGLAYLNVLDRPPPTLWAPGQALYDRPSADLLQPLFDDPRSPSDVDSLVAGVHELALGSVEIGGLEVRTRRQERHAHPTLALRFGDELAYCTDTAYDEANGQFAAGVRILCHEAWFTEDEPVTPESHSSGRQAARVAGAAQAGSLALVHVNPVGVDPARVLAEARSEFEPTVLGEDLLELG